MEPASFPFLFLDRRPSVWCGFTAAVYAILTAIPFLRHTNYPISQTGLVIFLAVWAAALLGYIPVEGPAQETLPYLPIWVLCCFGSYSLLTIGKKPL